MPDSRIELGVIGRPHGVRGLVKVTSHTANPADLTAYGPLSDARGRLFTLLWRGVGVAEVAVVDNGITLKIADRTAAERLTNTRLFVDRSALPAEDAEEFYLADLIGLSAAGPDGRPLGVVAVVHDYGAGASLEITRAGTSPLIVPFTRACVPEVLIAERRVVVVSPDEVVVPDTSLAAPEAAMALRPVAPGASGDAVA